MSEDQELLDPMEQLLLEMRTNPGDAEVLSQFLDVGILVKIFREMKYSAEERIRRLLDIAKNGTNTESMRAIKLIDETWQTALVRRGMMQGKGGALPPALADGSVPGLPKPVDNIDVTSRAVAETLDELDVDLENETTQPLQEPNHGKKTEDAREQDDGYFADDRSENPSIHRPPTRDHGQCTAIG
jgi:hypothetical protein